MFKNEREFARIMRDLKVDATPDPDYRERLLRELLAMEKRQNARQAASPDGRPVKLSASEREEEFMEMMRRLNPGATAQRVHSWRDMFAAAEAAPVKLRRRRRWPILRWLRRFLADRFMADAE